MTFHSSSETTDIDYDFVVELMRDCEGCGAGFIPVSDEPLCRDCAHELFESRPDEGTSNTGKKTEFINFYRHDDCPVRPGVEWTDKWTATCDDECPTCSRDISPCRSEDAETSEEVP